VSSSDSNPSLTPLLAEGESGDLGPGTRLGKYELIKRLSVGGMAEIFLARAVGIPGFQKLVAIKRILPQLATNTEFLEMFLDEARIAATLQHSHIVQTYDVCVLSGNYIIAMEYLHGEDLRSILSASVRAGQRIPLEHVLQIMISLTGALHYAHEKEDFEGRPLEIVHRDVSPGNVIVTFDGGIKLLDFGIAKARTQTRESNTGSVKGKVSYMSPEQARGEQVDRRTDVFAAGVILYELALGRKLYRGTDYEVLTNIVKGTFDKPSQVDAGFDAQLEQIILRALSAKREARYATAHEMQLALESLARARGLFFSSTGLKQMMEQLFARQLEAWRQAQKQGKSLIEHLELEVSYEDEKELPEPAPQRSRRRPLVLAAVGGAALLLTGALALRGRHPAPPVPRTSAAPAQVAPPVVPVPPPAESPPAAVDPSGAAAGSVKVVTHPHDARVLIDGRAVSGHSPYAVDGLAPGEHTVVAQLHGFADGSKRFAVAAGQAQTLTLSLNKAAAAPAAQAPKKVPAAPAPASAPAPTPAAAPSPKLEGNGTLAIASNPWVLVTVDGVARGQTPLSLTLPAGKHTILLSNPEYKVKRQLSVSIAPGETVRKKLDFTE
jgi:serine/threonine protein kinase